MYSGKPREDQASVQVTETDRFLTIESEKFTYRYSKLSGLFEQVSLNGKELLAAPMEVNIWRAPTDNDRKIKLNGQNVDMTTRASSQSYDTTWEIRRGAAGCVNDESVIIHSTMPWQRERSKGS